MNTSPINQRPIAFFKWMEDFDDNKIIRRIPERDGEIYFASGSSRVELLSAIQGWLLGNDHPQYLFLLAHGLIDDDGVTCQAIGDSWDDGAPLSWADLWGAVKIEGQNRPNIFLIGCHTNQVYHTVRNNLEGHGKDPYVATLNTYINAGHGLRSTLLCFKTFMANLRSHGKYIDEEFSDLMQVVKELEIFYPTAMLNGTTELVPVSDFEAVVGKSFRDYLTEQPRRL